MRISVCLLVVLTLTGLISTSSSVAQKELARSTQILSAKTIYFDNQTGSDGVGISALAELKKWRKFQIVPDRKQEDLIFFLSADPCKGGNIIMSGGQTGSISRPGRIGEDP